MTWRLALLVFLGAAGVAGVLCVVMPKHRVMPTHRVTKENFDRIQNGLTEKEVAEILGRDGDYGPGEALELPGGFDGPQTFGLSYETWTAGDVWIRVYFYDGKVAQKVMRAPERVVPRN